MKAIKATLISTILAMYMASGASAEEPTVHVAADPYPPWTEGAVGSSATGGIAVEIVGELFRRLGMEVLVNVYPFKRGLDRIEHGEEDVILMVSRSEERESYMLFTSPVREVKFVFYGSAESDALVWKEWQDLKPYRIGGVSGYNLGEEWKAAVEEHGLNVEEVKTDVFNVEKLLAGRVDLIVADDEVMRRIIESNPKYQGKLKSHAGLIFASVNNFGIAKASFLAPMLARIDEVLQEMKDDGTFQRIFCAYEKSYGQRCGGG